MIHSKREYLFYLRADRMMNREKFTWSLRDRLVHILFPDYIMLYLKSMRYIDFFTNGCKKGAAAWWLRLPLFVYHRRRWRQLGFRTGLSIGFQTLGYGVVIPHNGTIVIGGDNRIGNFAVLQTCSCITGAPAHHIGDALYMATGAKILGDCRLGDNVTVAANSVVMSSCPDNVLMAGMPASVKADSLPWYDRDGAVYRTLVDKVIEFREQFLGCKL